MTTTIQVNMSLYLYPQDYISSKGTNGELKCFIKPLTMLETSSIDRVLFSIIRTGIEQQSRHLETPGFFLYHFQSIEPKFRQIENNDFRIFTQKIPKFEFLINESISPNSNIIITTYPCIYLYIQQFGTDNMKFDLQNWLSSAMMSLAKCNEELTI